MQAQKWGPTNLLRCPSTAPGVVASAILSVLQVGRVGGGPGWLRGAAQGRTRDRGNATGPVRPPRVPTRVPRAAGAPCMSSQPRAWSIRGQWGRWGGGGSGDRQCPGAPPPSPLPILSMQMLFICVLKLNSWRRRPESAISGSALSHFTGGQRPAAGMSQLENHRRLTRAGVLGVWSCDMVDWGSCGVQVPK